VGGLLEGRRPRCFRQARHALGRRWRFYGGRVARGRAGIAYDDLGALALAGCSRTGADALTPKNASKRVRRPNFESSACSAPTRPPTPARRSPFSAYRKWGEKIEGSASRPASDRLRNFHRPFSGGRALVPPPPDSIALIWARSVSLCTWATAGRSGPCPRFPRGPGDFPTGPSESCRRLVLLFFPLCEILVAALVRNHRFFLHIGRRREEILPAGPMTSTVNLERPNGASRAEPKGRNGSRTDPALFRSSLSGYSCPTTARQTLANPNPR